MNIFWFLPTHGESRYLGSAKGGRVVDHTYLCQIAQAADRLGFGGVLIPTGVTCEDPWLVAASVVGVTRHLKLLVALRPGVTSAAQAARQTATLDRLSQGRVLINVVAGGDANELAGEGLFLDHDARYAATEEFMHVWKRLLAGETVDFEGQYQRVKGARLLFPPVQRPHPPVYIGGSSPAAHDYTARETDLYLTWGEPPAAVAAKLADVRTRAAAVGRSVRFGVRLHVIVRETEAQAWAAAERLIADLDDETIAAAQRAFARSDSEGQRRMAALHRQGAARTREALEVSPNLWAGVGLVRGGAGTALVGDPQQVAARLQEYADLGIDTFILSGYPHLEEAYRVAELLFPLLPVKLPEETVKGVLNNGPVGDTGTLAWERPKREAIP